MIELLADNPALKYLLLVSLFALVSALVYFGSLSVTSRQMTRQRLTQAAGSSEQNSAIGSLRSDRVQSAWLKLVNGIE